MYRFYNFIKERINSVKLEFFIYGFLAGQLIGATLITLHFEGL